MLYMLCLLRDLQHGVDELEDSSMVPSDSSKPSVFTQTTPRDGLEGIDICVKHLDVWSAKLPSLEHQCCLAKLTANTCVQTSSPSQTWNACLRRVGWYSRARASPPRGLPRLTTTRSFDRDPPAPHGTTRSYTASSTCSRTQAHNFDITHLLGPSAERHPILIPIRRGVRCSAHEGRHAQEWQGGGGEQITSCSARHGRDGYGRGADMPLRPPGSGAGGGCGRENSLQHVERVARGAHPHAAVSVPLRLQSQYTALPPHALHSFSYSDVLPGLPFVLTSHRLHHIDLVPIVLPLSPCRAFLTPGASSPLLPFRRREYQSICASPARGPSTRGPFASAAAAAASFPRGTAPSAGGEGAGRESLAVALDGAAPPASSREDDPHASGAGSGIGLHRARRWWWEWEGRLVRRTSRRRLAREGGYDGARRVCPTSIIVARSSEACAPRGRDAVRKRGGGGGGVVEAGAGEEDVETRTPASSSPAPSPAAPAVLLSTVSPPATEHALRLLCIRLERARRLGPRTTLADAESTARMRRRMEKGEAEREREREEKRESGACVTRRAPARSPHRPRRGGEGGGGEMVDGDGDEESAHDVLGMGRRRVRVRNELKHQCNFPNFPLRLHPDGALRPLRVDYSSGSTTTSHNHPLLSLKPAPKDKCALFEHTPASSIPIPSRVDKSSDVMKKRYIALGGADTLAAANLDHHRVAKLVSRIAGGDWYGWRRRNVEELTNAQNPDFDHGVVTRWSRAEVDRIQAWSKGVHLCME
ncbi:hypothetical protein B0H14DRAFT_2591058 [Mycena olivaceomarginata]|nr:hypothetical protein B0H14DRAFT_2591058 [Mycena olivaceomarginata]